MRILYLDIDALRPDHLGCYGYSRPTSPNLDRLAAGAWRFDACHASDVPCCPSRTSLFAGRFGVNHGVLCHAGRRAEPFSDGPDRGFQARLERDAWMAGLQKAGYYTAAISSFGARHSAWWWTAGFREILDTGGNGMELAEDVADTALDWLDRRGRNDCWFLHVNLWDAHTPYRTPESFGEPFVDHPTPTWLNESVRQKHWLGCGPQCARERGAMNGHDEHRGRFPRQPHVMASSQDVRRMFDGYDTAVRYLDHHVGRLIDRLDQIGVLDDTAILVSADHGETLGELNIYGCHQTVDAITTRVPALLHWPGLSDRANHKVRPELIYHIDLAATVLELAGGAVPSSWDAQSLAQSLRHDEPHRDRPYLVLSQMQGTCQRAVRFRRDDRDYILIRTFHDGLHDLPANLIYDLTADPHHQHDLADHRPDLVAHAQRCLQEWAIEHDLLNSASARRPGPADPMVTVLDEGGPPHSRGRLDYYLARLKATGRHTCAQRLHQRHLALRQ